MNEIKAVDYIIVQAGGRGTRLEYLTANKPKALVPVENLPMLFHLFREFPDKRFVIIADYKKEVLREYLECFAEVKYQIVDSGGSGTCAGVRQALDFIPDGKPFMLVWSDLILPERFQIPEDEENFIGISETFHCRWSYQNRIFEEVPSEQHGVAGLFVFKEKSCLADVPENGELVRWMHLNRMEFSELGLAGTKEFGVLSEYEKLEVEKCRPFNKLTFDGEVLIKEGIDEQGRKLARLESKWYELAISKGIAITPEIYSTNPIRMERINGKNIYEYSYLPIEEKKAILKKLCSALKALHETEIVPADPFSVKEAYYSKTMDRLNKIRYLVPFADQKEIMVNGRSCRNVFFYKRELEKRLESIRCENFSFIHGDCTFSNMMLRENGEPVLIDPRGYFGFTEMYGDPNYDWAKLYYSIVGNYDRFNLKDFQLTIGDKAVNLDIKSNQWELLEDEFFKLSGTKPQTIRLLHAVIWLSLTTYAWQDYDSICGAFYNGLYYLKEVL